MHGSVSLVFTATSGKVFPGIKGSYFLCQMISWFLIKVNMCKFQVYSQHKFLISPHIF